MVRATRPTLRPLHDRVLVSRLADGNDTHGNIIIPDTAKEKPQQGTVVAVGPGGISETGRKQPLTVKRGDHILFGKHAGSEVKLDGHEYLIMKEEDILGVLTHAGGK